MSMVTEQPFAESKPIAEMSLVEIAEQLGRVTSWIEAERTKERDARTSYEAIRQQVETHISQIKGYAQELVRMQGLKMSSFGNLLGRPQDDQAAAAIRPRPQGPVAKPKNLAEAIVGIWTLDKFNRPLTTEEIGEALPEIGYASDAAPASLKSSVNQALAKLCRVGRVCRLRADGSRIPPRDLTSRARKYIAAFRIEGTIED